MATVQVDRNNDTPVSLQNDRASGLRSSTAYKGPVITASLTNLTLSGEQTVAGIAVVDGDRVGAFGQTDGTENGLYIVSTGEWQRAADFNRTDDVFEGTQVNVTRGTNAGLYLITTIGSIVFGTTNIVFGTYSFPEVDADLAAAEAAADAAELAETGAVAAQAAAEAAAASVTPVVDQINGATDTDFLDADMLTARKASNGSLIKRSWLNVKALLKTYFDTLYLSLTTADQVVTGGVRVTSLDLGTPVAASTVTLDPGDRPLQHLTNNAAFTLAPGANTGSFFLDITNGASAGAITTSGWTKVVGAFTTTNAHKFRCSCSIANGGSLLSIQALQ
jgi:hypothetical protein